MTVDFELDGQRLVALNGGPQYTFSEAVSFVVNCETQEKVDQVLGKALRGRGEGAVRLAQGPVRAFPGRSLRASWSSF